MNKNANISARIDPATKIQAQGILRHLNMTMSDAVGIFLKQVVLNKGIPFDVKIPNKVTAETLEEAENGKNIKSFDNTDDLFEELNR